MPKGHKLDSIKYKQNGAELYYVDGTDSWRILFKENDEELSSKNSFSVLSCLPFLELAPCVFQEMVRKYMMRQKVETEKSLLEFIVVSGFIHGSAHWVNRSLAHLEKLPIASSEEILFHLQNISVNKKYSQRIRHLSRKLFKEAKTGN